MNPKSTLSFTAGIFFSFWTMYPSSDFHIPTERKEERTEATKRANYVSRNNHAVKIYPDLIKKTMHVIAKENDGKKIDFFVFDLQGVLLKHYRMAEGDHEKIAGLKRGKYVYHVFCGDEETASGKFDIR